MSKIRVGFVGLGRIADLHILGYHDNPQAGVYSVCDAQPEMAERRAQEWGIERWCTDYQEMLADPALDAIEILTPHHLHAQMTIAGLEAGKHVSVQKPMAMNLAEADAMLAACEEAGTALAIGHMRRYNPHYVEARRLIEEGAIGEVDRMWAYMGGWDVFLWGIHYADMLHYLNGDGSLRWVMGQVDYSQRGMSYPYSESFSRRRPDWFIAEDNALGLMQFDNGVRVAWESGSHSPELWRSPDGQHSGYCEIRIYGAEGEIRVGDAHLGHRVRGAAEWTRISYLDPERREQFYDDQFVAELRELVDCLEQGGEHRLNGRRGRKALEMLMAIYESSRRRALVQLPLQVSDNPLFAMVRAGDIGQ
jgi:predicted dehydrogenase